MRLRRALGALGILSAIAAGCASVIGLDGYHLASELDAAAPAEAAVTVPGEAGGSDAATPCPRLLATDGGRTALVLRARDSGRDGGFGGGHDFRGCPSLVLDPTTAAFVVGQPKASAVVALEWEPDALWVGVDVTDAALEGAPPGSGPYFSDSIELYVSSDPNRAATYGIHDHQVITDYRGETLHRLSPDGGIETYAETSVELTGAGYRVVTRFDAKLLGVELASNGTLFFDALLNDGIGQQSFLIWARDPPDGGFPSVDPRVFTSVTLE